MRVAIIKYNAGNTASVTNALARLGICPILTDDPNELLAADKVIFPGVGEASSAMKFLTSAGLDTAIRAIDQPFLGICLGMQLLCESSEENSTDCLGIVPLKVRRFSSSGLKVPEIGWNTIGNFRSPLFKGVPDGSYLYFVHGFYVETGAATAATTAYGVEFSSALFHKNFHAVQFHPEKSGSVGRRILENFLSL